MTPDARKTIGLLFNQPEIIVATGLRYLHAGSRMALEELGVIGMAQVGEAEHIAFTPHGWEVAQVASSYPEQ